MKKAVFYVLMFVFIQLCVSVVFTFGTKLIDDTLSPNSPTVLLMSMFTFGMLTIMVFAGLKWSPLKRDYLLSRPWLVLFWCSIAAMGAVIPSMAFQEQLPELPNVVEQQLTAIMDTRGGYFVVALMAPLAEEMVFRGAALRVLLEWRPDKHWLMIVVSALFFAGAHFNPAQMPHAFVIGLLLGWMYYRTGSIVPGVAYHWVNNTVAYLAYKFYPNPEITLVDIFGSTQRVITAVLFSLLILLPAIYQLHLWMKHPKETK